MTFAVDLRKRLINVEADVGDPVSELELRNFEQKEKVCLSATVKEVYLALNGFQLLDQHNMFTFWPLQQLVGTKETEVIISGFSVRPVGDFFISSDCALASIAEDEAPVYLESSKKAVAKNLRDFLNQISQGVNIYGTFSR